MVTDETEDVYNSTELDPAEAVHDSGATSVIVGHETLKGYCKQLVAKGFPVEKMKFFPCTKNFRYGNDATGEATACAVVPSVPGGKFVEILT